MNVAIIGMSCRTAGTETLAGLWKLLRSGERRVSEVPADRWYGLDRGPAPAEPARAALLDRIDEFDAKLFGIAPRMAAWMEPQHRIMLELAWHALEDAALDPDALRGQPVAVFTGSFLSDYRERMHARGASDGAAFPGTLTAFHANRISYQFGWTGPSMVIDSACSSSLGALGLAVQGLRAGEYPMAVVGASNVISNGFYANAAYQSGALSPTGRSVPFELGRDGYVRGEGGVCVVLKMLDRAVADGDPIHAVIRAVGNAHNGRAGGLTGSDAGAQRQLLHATARAAGIEVGDLGYLEAHGTGTPGGDRAEIEALVDALGDDEGERLWVGSIKASVGHLEAAAGLLGLVKTVLMMRHGLIPRIAGLDKIDPALRLGARVGIAAEDVPWPSSGPRLAAVNSFGLGGTMSCAVVEEYRAPEVVTRPPAERRIPLGAGSDEALAVLATRLADAVEEDPALDLADVAWTLRTARRPHPVRCVVAVSDRAMFVARMAELAGDPRAAARDAGAGPWEGAAARRVHLPGTPFTRRSYWFDRQAPAPIG